MDVAPLATLTGLLLIKEIGVPIPVPGDLLVLGAGAATSGRAEATPGVRVAPIAASGVAALPARAFLPGFLVGNTVFVGGHFAVGFVLGKPAVGIPSDLGNPIVLAAILVLLSAAGAIAWLRIRGRRAAKQVDATESRHGVVVPTEGGFAAWADAACPICFTLAALGVDRAD
jgi:membrane protein DedA with SNARE-associated domain